MFKHFQQACKLTKIFCCRWLFLFSWQMIDAELCRKCAELEKDMQAVVDSLRTATARFEACETMASQALEQHLERARAAEEKQKAKDARIKLEMERRLKDKAEKEAQAKAFAELEAKARAEREVQEQLAKLESDRLAAARAEQERLAQLECDRLACERAEAEEAERQRLAQLERETVEAEPMEREQLTLPESATLAQAAVNPQVDNSESVHSVVEVPLLLPSQSVTESPRQGDSEAIDESTKLLP
jgi:hypothetical protein